MNFQINLIFLIFLIQALIYLKSHNIFYKDISISKGLSGQDIFRFSDIAEIQG